MAQAAGQITVIRLEGDFSSESMVAFRNRLAREMDQGRVRVVLDLDGMAHISERGLGLLCDSCLQLRRMGGSLRVAAGANGAGAFFARYEADRWLERYPTVAAALARPWPNGREGGGHVS